MDNREEILVEEGEDFVDSQSLISIIAIVTLGLLAFVIFGYCCKKSQDPTDDDTEESKSLVIAREVKPGYLIIQGNNNEEIFRIIKEYDSARQGSNPTQPQFMAAANPDVHQMRSQAIPLQTHNPGGFSGWSQPSAPVDNSRPPPYAPINMMQYTGH